MGTFSCREECSFFCKSPAAEDFLFKTSDLYPGLTVDERALAAKESVKALVAYRLSLKAEKLCQGLYSSSSTNDESDACRHFVWAALLRNEVGSEFGNLILNAHEQDPKQLIAEKSMDLANNRLGLISAEELIKSKKFSEDAILDSFKKSLEKSQLIILKKRPTSTGGQR